MADENSDDHQHIRAGRAYLSKCCWFYRFLWFLCHRFDYRGKSFEYEQLGAWCRQCPEGVLTGDETTATEPLLDAFVTQVHKEETKELARIRKKLKLTQQQAANLTGGGHNAFSRYERGDARPLPAVMNLFRLLDHHPELLKEL